MKEPHQEPKKDRFFSTPMRAFPDSRTTDAANIRASYVLVLIFFLLAAGILTAGYLYFRTHQKHYLDKVGHELTAIKDLKVSELAQWRKERLDDSAILFGNTSFSDLVIRYFNNPEDHGARKQLLEWIGKFQGRDEFNQVRLLDVHGVTRLSVPGNLRTASAGELKDLLEIIRLGQPSITDFYRSGNDRRIYLAVRIPILNEENGHPLGILSLRIDPEEYLYPLIQHWPTPSRTGETLLIRREGDEVIFLNELRHRKDTAFSLRFPLSKKDLPAAMAVLGTTGVVEGVDYRGVPVIASVGAIPHSPWFIVSKMDKEEIYAPMRERLWLTVIFVGVLLLGSGLGIGLIWRQQRIHFYRERYQTAEALRESEQKYRVLVETMNEGLGVQDRNGIITYMNRRAYEMFGYKSDELLGRPIDVLFDEEGLKDFKAQMVRRRQGTEESYEVVWRRKDGGRVHTLVAPHVIYDAEGNYDGSFGIFIDITERKLAEENLRKSEAFIKNILESVGEGFIVIDPDYKIISANRAYCEMQKARLEDIIGKHCYEVSHHSDKPCFMEGEDCAPRHTFKTGEPYLTVHTHYDKENNPSYIETRSYPMKDAEGKIIAVIEVLNNITEKRMLESQLRHAQKMEAIGTLAGGIAHDFNNMLNIIIGYASLMQMHMKPDDPKMGQVKEILNAGDRAAQLTRGLLTFSRKQVMEIRTINFNEIIEGFKKMISRIIGEDIELKIVHSEEALTVKADLVLIEQVLLNLASNAKDAMPRGGVLTIDTMPVNIDSAFIKMHGYGEPGMYALITVTDTGAGMDDRTRERIFEPFFTTKELGRGTGLGLSIVYGIVKQHNGYINCYSEPGKGTTFKIYLPLIKEEAEKIEMSEAELPKGGSETILLAEDEASVRGLIKEILEGVGYTVIEAVDGEDAVVKFRENKERIHLLLFDMIMPKKNGKDAYEDIKGISHDIKALFMSGYAADIIDRFGIKEDIEFISKPVSPNELLRKVRDTLG